MARERWRVHARSAGVCLLSDCCAFFNRTRAWARERHSPRVREGACRHFVLEFQRHTRGLSCIRPNNCVEDAPTRIEFFHVLRKRERLPRSAGCRPRVTEPRKVLAIPAVASRVVVFRIVVPKAAEIDNKIRLYPKLIIRKRQTMTYVKPILARSRPVIIASIMRRCHVQSSVLKAVRLFISIGTPHSPMITGRSPRER
jgi:hypothetical protein